MRRPRVATAVDAARRASSARSSGILAANAAIAVLNLVSGILIARGLGPTLRGDLALAQILPSAGATVALLGLPDAVVYFSAKRPGASLAILATARAAALRSVIVFLAAAAAILLVLRPWIGSEIAYPGIVFASIGLAYAALNLPLHSLQGLAQFSQWNRARLVTPIAWALVAVAVAVRPPSSLVPFALASLATVGLSGIVAHRLLRRHVAARTDPDDDPVDRRDMLRYGVPLSLAQVPTLLSLRLDVVIFGLVAERSEAGVYAVATVLGAVSAPVFNVISSQTTPRLAGVRGDAHELHSEARTVVRRTLLLAVALLAPACGVVVLAAQVLGPGYEEFWFTFLLMAVAGNVAGINLVMSQVLRGMGRVRSVLRCEVAGLLVSVTLLVILAPRLGLVGGALASIAGYSTTALLAMWYSVARRTSSPGPTTDRHG